MRRYINNFVFTLTIYLIGLLIGGLYVGMVAPLRSIFQIQFYINESIGVWIINIYSLFYVAIGYSFMMMMVTICTLIAGFTVCFYSKSIKK